MIDDNLSRISQLSIGRKVLTAFAVFMTMLCGLFSSFIEAADDKTTILPSPTATSTQLPALVTVEYQIHIVTEKSSALVEFWYTSESGGQNQLDSLRINNANPFTKTIVMTPGAYVEIGGILANRESGLLICRILVDDVLIEQSRSRSIGGGAHCAGVALPSNK